METLNLTTNAGKDVQTISNVLECVKLATLLLSNSVKLANIA
jgi:hypothetical protein